MVSLEAILAGFADAATLSNLFYIIIGVIIGQVVGAIPGIGPVMTVAIVIPFTFVLNPLTAISFLIGIYKGGLVGGAVPAILINTPGTPDAAATAFDGYPLAKQGKPLKATKMALFSSVTGDTISDISLIIFSIPLAMIALKMGPVEVFALIVFSFSIIAGLVDGSIAKAVISLLLGLLFGSVGLEPENSTPRLIFDIYELYDGFPIVSVAIGMLAMSQILIRLASITNTDKKAITIDDSNEAHKKLSFKEYWHCRFTLLRGAGIGVFLGAIPGIGSTAAAFMSYAFAKASQQKNEPKYGEGNIRGIAATESANSAINGSSLIPLLSLGIPGSISAALLIGAFMMHGLTPGPTLFEKNAALVYAIFGAMLIANMSNLITGLVAMRLWIKVINTPETIIFPISIILCIVGVYLSSGTVLGIMIMFGFAILGILMQAFGYSVVIFIIAYFLQNRLEETYVQSITILSGDFSNIFNHPIGVLFLVLAVVSLVFFTIQHKKQQIVKNL